MKVIWIKVDNTTQQMQCIPIGVGLDGWTMEQQNKRE
jgi:hypothetical protein